LRCRHDARFYLVRIGREGPGETVGIDPKKAMFVRVNLCGAGWGWSLLAEALYAANV
jgi:hypothetical protein